ncbi:MAG: diheme cytochrome c [Sulfuricurvum sp.]|nr:diheme cytochrome c [Sulfuricurvum sp.]
MKKLWNVSLAAALLVGGVSVYAEDDEMEHARPMQSKPLSKQDQSAAALYKKECSACHMAYQPEFLPKRSWDKTMKGLDNHFGTDATMDTVDSNTVQNYLMTYASKNDRITDMRGAVALRISQTPHFVKEHRKISKKMITQPAVKSIANCNACHTKAEVGSYREREINIPNYGRWE